MYIRDGYFKRNITGTGSSVANRPENTVLNQDKVIFRIFEDNIEIIDNKVYYNEDNKNGAVFLIGEKVIAQKIM